MNSPQISEKLYRISPPINPRFVRVSKAFLMSLSASGLIRGGGGGGGLNAVKTKGM